MVDYTLLIGIIGATTGIASLILHFLNSRSKVILERVHFTRSHRHTHKEVIDITGNIRNKSNRATTIEKIYLHFGRREIPLSLGTNNKIEPNSSYKIDLHSTFTLELFKDIMDKETAKLETNMVKLGIEIEHTFGTIEKHGYTDFSTDWLSVY